LESPGVRKALQADPGAVSIGSCLDGYFDAATPEVPPAKCYYM